MMSDANEITVDEDQPDREVTVWRGPGQSWGLVHTDRFGEEETDE